MSNSQTIKDLSNRPIQVYNKLKINDDGEPIGLTHDSSIPSSMNYGSRRDPKQGYCYKPDGTNYIHIPAFTKYIREFTVAFWMKSDSTPTTKRTILSNRLTSRSGNMDIEYTSEGLVFKNWGNTGSVTAYDVPVSFWNHFAVTFKMQGNSIWYRNGIPVAKAPTGLIIPNLDNQVVIGGKPESTEERLIDVELRDFLYIDKELSRNQIRDLINSRVPDMTNSQGSFYKMDEGAGSTAYDSSGLDRHGTIINLNADFHSIQDEYSWHNRVGFTNHFDPSTNTNVLIPRKEPIREEGPKDILGNTLEFIGSVPLDAKFSNSKCFNGKGTSSLSASVTDMGLSVEYSVSFNMKVSDPNQTGTILAMHSEQNLGNWEIQYTPEALVFGFVDSGGVETSSIFNFTEHDLEREEALDVEYLIFESFTKSVVNGIEMATPYSGSAFTPDKFTVGKDSLGFNPLDCDIWNISIKDIAYQKRISHWPLCETIFDIVNHTYYNTIGEGNHLQLISGSYGSGSTQDSYHYIQNGYNKEENKLIPASSVNLDLDSLGNPLEFLKSKWLHGSCIQIMDVPEMRYINRSITYFKSDSDSYIHKVGMDTITNFRVQVSFKTYPGTYLEDSIVFNYAGFKIRLLESGEFHELHYSDDDTAQVITHSVQFPKHEGSEYNLTFELVGTSFKVKDLDTGWELSDIWDGVDHENNSYLSLGSDGVRTSYSEVEWRYFRLDELNSFHQPVVTKCDIELSQERFLGSEFICYYSSKTYPLVGDPNWSTTLSLFKEDGTPRDISQNYCRTYLTHKGKKVFTGFKDNSEGEFQEMSFHMDRLTDSQEYREKTVRGVEPKISNWILDGGYWDSSRDWNNSSKWNNE